MKHPINQNLIHTAMRLSMVYVIVTLFLPNHLILLWLTAVLIVINYGLSLTHLFQRGSLTPSLMLLNGLQLLLYGRLHIQIHDILGMVHYSYNHVFIYHAHWYDWVKFIAAYVLHAVDLIDVLNSYGFELQHLKPRSMLAKGVVFSMQTMVDIFLLSGFFMYLQRHQLIATVPAKTGSPLTIELSESVKDGLKMIKQARWIGLKVAIGLTLLVGMQNHWRLENFWLWPLENILRTLDFGDAFQIFAWQLHTVTPEVNVVTLAVFLRLEVSFYVLPWVNYFYLWLLRGRGRTFTDLLLIASSPESSKEEQRIAFQALVKLGGAAVPLLTEILANTESHEHKLIIVKVLRDIGSEAASSVSQLVKLLVNTNENLRLVASQALPKIIPNWPRSAAIREAVPYLITALQASQKEVRLTAARTLGRIGATAIPTVAPLVKTALRDDDAQVRQAASFALRHQGTATCEAVSQFTEALVNGNDETRLAAAEALGHLGTAASLAVPSLRQIASTDWDGNIRLAAQQALRQIDPTGEIRDKV